MSTINLLADHASDETSRVLRPHSRMNVVESGLLEHPSTLDLLVVALVDKEGNGEATAIPLGSVDLTHSDIEDSDVLVQITARLHAGDDAKRDILNLFLDVHDNIQENGAENERLNAEERKQKLRDEADRAATLARQAQARADEAHRRAVQGGAFF